MKKLSAQPFCRYCGKPIGKHTETTFVRVPAPGKQPLPGYVEVAAYPATKTEAQKLTNKQIVSVKRTMDKTGIDEFNTWDGETYADEFFCKNSCAVGFAYMLARLGHQTKAHEAATKRKAK